MRQSGCGEVGEMATRPAKRSLRYEIFALVAAVLAGVMQLDAAVATTQPGEPLDARELLAKVLPAVVRIQAYSPAGKEIAKGSGFLIDADGTVVTNHLVMKGAASVRVLVRGRAIPAAGIIATDEKADVAIIKMKGKGLAFLTLRTDLPKVGDKVYAIKNPSGQTNTLCDGLVKDLLSKEGVTLIQLSGSIRRGWGGGALFDSSGRVLGLEIPTAGVFKGEKPGLVVASKRIASLVKSASSSKRIPVKLGSLPPVKAVITPKAYASLGALLSQIPPALALGTGSQLSSSQKTAVNGWLGKNVLRGSMLAVEGRFAGASRGAGGMTLTFRRGVVSIHGKKILLRATAGIDQEFTEQVQALKAGAPPSHLSVAGVNTTSGRGNLGTPITVHGKIAQVAIIKGELCVRLTGGGFGKIPQPKQPTTKPKPKPRPRPKLAPKSPAKKAEGKFKLAKMYLAVGKKVKAIEILKGIVADYPGTPAAKEAAKKLKDF